MSYTTGSEQEHQCLGWLQSWATSPVSVWQASRPSEVEMRILETHSNEIKPTGTGMCPPERGTAAFAKPIPRHSTEALV